MRYPIDSEDLKGSLGKYYEKNSYKRENDNFDGGIGDTGNRGDDSRNDEDIGEVTISNDDIDGDTGSKITKDDIIREANMYLSNPDKYQSEDREYNRRQDFTNGEKPVDDLTIMKYASTCEWGEWGQYANCDEIISNVCKRLRTRNPNNAHECKSYMIDVQKCSCDDPETVNKNIVKQVEEDLQGEGGEGGTESGEETEDKGDRTDSLLSVESFGSWNLLYNLKAVKL